MRKHVSKADMVALDELSIKKYKHSLDEMKKRAAHALAKFIYKNYPPSKYPKILLLAGKGNNGSAGVISTIYLSKAGYEISTDIKKPNLVIDALIGYGLKGELKSKTENIINKINKLNLPVISLDTPSGLNVDSGEPQFTAIKATHTLVLAAMKKGLIKKSAKEFVGEIHLIDIGIPEKAYEELDLDYPFYNT